MWHTTEDGKYRVESLSATTFPGAEKLLKYHLFPDENVCISTGVNKNPLAVEELLELAAEAALDGLSLVAVEIDTDDVVAVLINKLQVVTIDTSEKSFFKIFAEQRCKQQSSRALVHSMVELNTRCNYFEKYGVDCSIELMYLGTHREHRRKGLAKLLVKTTLDLANKYRRGPYGKVTVEDLGPKYGFLAPRIPITKDPKICTGLWSAIGSKKIGKALGFEVLVTVSLKDLLFNGKKYTDEIGNDVFCEGAARRID